MGGTFHEVKYNQSLHLRAPGAAELESFLEAAVEYALTIGKNEVRVWKFSNLHGPWHWIVSNQVPSRPLETVVLPEAPMRELLRFLDDFYSTSAASWYFQHGIPYR